MIIYAKEINVSNPNQVGLTSLVTETHNHWHINKLAAKEWQLKKQEIFMYKIPLDGFR
jgi:hypothetical protein